MTHLPRAREVDRSAGSESREDHAVNADAVIAEKLASRLGNPNQESRHELQSSSSSR